MPIKRRRNGQFASGPHAAPTVSPETVQHTAAQARQRAQAIADLTTVTMSGEDARAWDRTRTDLAHYYGIDESVIERAGQNMWPKIGFYVGPVKIAGIPMRTVIVNYGSAVYVALARRSFTGRALRARRPYLVADLAKVLEKAS